jgi:hypothetical protein
MSETNLPSVRPDIDIKDDVNSLLFQYPPLANDRHHLHVDVSNGLVTVRGYVRTPITRRYLMDAIVKLPGVTGVNLRNLYDDESIRLDIAKLIPFGVLANVDYGNVVLTGKNTDEVSVDTLVTRIGNIPGVHRVVVAFRS